MQKIVGNVLVIAGTVVRVADTPSVEVRYAGDGTLATIYSTNSLGDTPKGNPFNADADGQYEFYIPNTRFTRNISGGGLVGTETISDVMAFDPAAHFAFSNLNSGYIPQQNSSGIWSPVAPSTLPFVNLTSVSCGNPSLKFNPTSGFPVLDVIMTGTGWVQAWRTSSGMGGTPVLAMRLDNNGVLTVSGNVVAAGVTLGGGGGGTTAANWGTATGPIFTFSGALDDGMWLRSAHVLTLTASGGLAFIDLAGTYMAQNVPSYYPAGTAAAPTVANSNGARAGLYFPSVNVPGLTSSGGILTAILDAASGFVLNSKTYVGNACGLTTSSQIITASKTIALADLGVTQVCSTGTNITITVPTNASVAVPVGSVLPLFRIGAGTVTVTSGGAVAIHGKQFTVNSLSGASLEKIATDTWLMRA